MTPAITVQTVLWLSTIVAANSRFVNAVIRNTKFSGVAMTHFCSWSLKKYAIIVLPPTDGWNSLNIIYKITFFSWFCILQMVWKEDGFFSLLWHFDLHSLLWPFETYCRIHAKAHNIILLDTLTSLAMSDLLVALLFICTIIIIIVARKPFVQTYQHSAEGWVL